MQNNCQMGDKKKSKIDFVTVPVDYDVDEACRGASIQLWRRALEEMASELSESRIDQARKLLEIHAFLRDPIGGLKKPFEKQLSLFYRILDAFGALYEGDMLSLKEWQLVIAQACQESSYLENPYLENVSYVHFHGHQQLPYVYIPLNSLPRSEFSNAHHVLKIVEEILRSTAEGGLCHIAPIAIASYPSLIKGGGKPLTVIIDGNHRATVVALLQFLASKPVAARKGTLKIPLAEYCQKHGLGTKWQIDLLDVLDELCSIRGKSCSDLLDAEKDLVGRFASINQIPALVVQEESFHTVCQQRGLGSKPKILLPMHQTLFNDDSLGFAFPQAGQVHGRALGFRPMPLIPSTTKAVDRYGADRAMRDDHWARIGLAAFFNGQCSISK